MSGNVGRKRPTEEVAELRAILPVFGECRNVGRYFPVCSPAKNVRPSDKCQKQSIYLRTYAVKSCRTKRPTNVRHSSDKKGSGMALDEQDYHVLSDIAKSLRRIADFLESDYIEAQINTIAAGIDRIAEAVEGETDV